MSGDLTTIGALKRVSRIDGAGGHLIAGQDHWDVDITGGTITGVDMSGTNVRASNAALTRTQSAHARNFIFAADEFDTTASDCTAGMTACIVKAASEKKIIIMPPGVIKLGEVPLLSGVQIWGQGCDGYGDDGSGNLTLWRNTLFQRLAGAGSVFTAGSSGDIRGVRLSNFGIDGVNRDCNGITGELFYWTIDNLYIGKCRNAIGSETLYTHILKVHHCTMYSNNIAIKNTIDSHFDNIIIASSQDDSIQLLSGADSNLFSNCRIEWGYGYGATLYGSQRQTFANCQFDRCAAGAMKIADTANHINVVGGFMDRCASRDDTDHQGSVFIDGTANNLSFFGISFNKGKDDDGGGTESPRYHFWFNSGTISKVNIVGNVGLDGATVGPVYYNAAQPTPYRLQSNLGVNDLLLGQVINRDDEGYYFSKASADINNSATGNFDLSAPAIGTFSRAFKTLQVYVRNKSSGATYQGKFDLTINREGSGASVGASAIYGEAGTAGVIRVGSSTLNLAFTNVATDGSTFRVTCANTVGAAVTVNMRLA